MIEFIPFPKIARWSREVIVTEKIDGTNAQVHISDDGMSITAGSRTRWIYPGNDNFGFAAWVEANKAELLHLGPGSHFGEWWGSGIQRGYGLKEKRFSLFSVSRWSDDETRPKCCGVVPTLWRGDMNELHAQRQIDLLRLGSVAAPGFMKPEGIVILHTATSALYKKTLEGDESPKNRVRDADGNVQS